ncbi:hypothetical protein KFL_006340120 [Klebsormidium nitens]|uniref:Uncharacterized protein n=1 Tax=Klebsormidium nitens TaxID=105231 RepID=A0A1Y1II56_KLENI|nr:hypothetical protein KFL_006340120 [Klebsormidium nitens]|eukprot:GAQ90393.1 hypothetical protein KFL_006340120 [Klebsormidium nitens]
MGKSSGKKTRPGKTETNKFSRIGPTLVAWIDSQVEEVNIEAAFQQEVKQRQDEVKETPVPPKQMLKPPELKLENPRAAPTIGEAEETDHSCIDESDAPCWDSGDFGDDDERGSEASFAEREPEYSSDEECYQIDPLDELLARLRNAASVHFKQAPRDRVEPLAQRSLIGIHKLAKLEDKLAKLGEAAAVEDRVASTPHEILHLLVAGKQIVLMCRDERLFFTKEVVLQQLLIVI